MLHLAEILLNVELTAQIADYHGEYFQKYRGMQQGDCLIAFKFALYITKASKKLKKNTAESKNDNYFNKQYASDISKIPTSELCLK